MDIVQSIIDAYVSVIGYAVPIAFTIACCNIGINIVVAAFTNGNLKIGGGR